MIGIFDSGVGGLTVVRELRKQLPEYDLIYFGDTARTPYGNKSKDTIIKYALEDANFLIQKGAKIIIVACNTASSVAYEVLKEKYPNIPIFEVIMPAVEQAIEATRKNRIGVIGTRATISSRVYEQKLKEKNGALIIKSQACPLFVPFIEEGWIKKIELKMIARRYLSSLKHQNIDTLILGCTHYPIIKNIIQEKIGRRVRLIDSAEAVSKKVKKFIEGGNLELPKTGKLEIYLSDKTEYSINIINRILGNNAKVYEGGNIK
ncbi:glutamate racemase [Patescibacteria group bacterium]|nr:glutamate racemase [Patescibacteria group bacterium]